MSDFNTPPPRVQVAIWLLAILFVTLGVVSWLAWQRFDSIAYMTTNSTAITGWAAFQAGWPVFTLAGVVTAIMGGILGLWAGENAKTHDAEARAKHANIQAAEAAKKAEKAQDRAEASLVEKVRRAEQREKQAHEAIIAAKAARSVLEKSESDALKEVTRLTLELSEAELGRKNAVGKMRRLEDKIKKRGGFADANNLTEIERLRSTIREDRDHILKLEARLRSMKTPAV